MSKKHKKKGKNENKKEINVQPEQKNVTDDSAVFVVDQETTAEHTQPDVPTEKKENRSSQKKGMKRSHILYAAGFLGTIIVCIACGAYYYYVHQDAVVYERKLQSEQYAKFMQQFEDANTQEIVTIQERILTDTWKKFISQYYGFEIMYPSDGWMTNVHKVDPQQTKAIYRIDFLKHSDVYNEPVGFSVSVYDMTVTKELAQTDEFPVMKSSDISVAGLCAVPSGHMFETGDYPAEELYVPPGDECYESVLFFTVVKGQYIYNITPIVNESAKSGDNDQMIAAVDVVPEFFSAVSRFANIEIVRPKPKPAVIRSSAPIPATYKKDHLGRKVCEKKNDKPGKSKENNKGKMHLDMECCLDPDEYPNPHCYYDPGKYGKYMK